MNRPLESVDLLADAANAKSFELDSNKTHSIELEGPNQKKIAFKTANTDFKVTISNKSGEKLTLIYDKASNVLMLDRTQSGTTNFNYEFGNKLQYMVMGEVQEDFEIEMYLDRSSIETFVNKGQCAMTRLIFPSMPYTTLTIENLSQQKIKIQDLRVSPMKSIWHP